MAIDRTYTITGFQASNGAVLVDVQATDGDYTHTVSGIYWLPIIGGVAPTGSALTSILTSYTNTAITDIEFNTAASIALAGGAVTNASDVYTSGVTATLVSRTIDTPSTSFTVDSTAGITAGMQFSAAGGTGTVTSVVGTTVNFTPAITFTPNFVVGGLVNFN